MECAPYALAAGSSHCLYDRDGRGVRILLFPLLPEPARKSFFGSLKGTVLKYERPFDPIDGDYDINHH